MRHRAVKMWTRMCVVNLVTVDVPVAFLAKALLPVTSLFFDFSADLCQLTVEA
jgi:hypothetical protein